MTGYKHVRRQRPMRFAGGDQPRTHKAKLDERRFDQVDADWCDEPEAEDEPPAWAEVDPGESRWSL